MFRLVALVLIGPIVHSVAGERPVGRTHVLDGDTMVVAGIHVPPQGHRRA